MNVLYAGQYVSFDADEDDVGKGGEVIYTTCYE